MSNIDFTEKRTKGCEDLMSPEIRSLLDLPLEEKIAKSKEIIKESLKKYPKVGFGFSGGSDSLIMLDLAAPIIPKDTPIVFVNTRFQFPETYEYINKVIKGYGLTNFVEVKAEKDRQKEFIGEFGLKTPGFTAACCKYHKIDPMMKAIGDLGLDAFFVGLRGVEHEERAKETLFSPRENPGHIRIHPILFWEKKDILDYIKQNNLECNPLYAQGYTSLGCVTCTEKNLDPNAHERAGRGVAREEIMKRLRDLGYT